MQLQQPAGAAAAAARRRREDGADAEDAADAAVDARAQVVALGTGGHPALLDQGDAIEMGAPQGVAAARPSTARTARAETRRPRCG